jgi:hypothetical protein
MAKRELPSPELLRKLLRYEPETGKLYWRERNTETHSMTHQVPEYKVANWNARMAGMEAFTAQQDGYLRGRVYLKTLSAHRVVWAIHYGEWPKDDIDHINHDRLDNRISNLRSVTRKNNNKNRSMRTDNTSGIMGVSWHKRTKKWIAYIHSDKGRKYLGLFSEKEEAESARKAAEAEFGYHPNHGAPLSHTA